jgi:hypothetical protein
MIKPTGKGSVNPIAAKSSGLSNIAFMLFIS